ncbi:hypothetical protein [Rhodosalinus sp. 5P4]|uniref:hypothetical protein n=1 Tax=Rhodosalinus sp. 5P4 TaxID=3239196 RepID=UPI003524EBD6
MRAALLVLLALLTLGAMAPGAAAQGFQVRPLTVEGEVPPGTTVDIPIEITGTSQLEGRLLEVDVVQLAQTPDGAFTIVPYEEGGQVLPRSAAPWITAPSEVQVDARQTTILEVLMRVPASAQGSHVAGLLLTARPPEDAEGLRLTLRLLVPIILGTEGRPARQDVRLADATLSYRLPDVTGAEGAAAAPFPETTVVTARVENRGGTYSRFGGDIWVDYKDASDTWRQIRRVPIEERRLLPETTLMVPVDLGRLLPAGDYRVRGELYVDGRRTVPLRREIAFEGHPDIKDLVTDIELGLSPEVFEYDYRAGARRTGSVTVENPSIDPVDVTVEVALPEGMGGRASAELRGEDLSAAGWIDVAPARFTLRPGQSRNLRLLARFPGTDAAHRNYYAELRLDARYGDGQRAGSATALVEVTRPEGEDVARAELEPLRVSSLEEAGHYALALRAVNTGNVLLRPEARYTLLAADGAELRRGDLASEAAGPLMPLAARSFGATLDLSELPEGEYVLLTILRDSGREVGEVTQRLSRSAEGVAVETVR